VRGWLPTGLFPVAPARVTILTKAEGGTQWEKRAARMSRSLSRTKSRKGRAGRLLLESLEAALEGLDLVGRSRPRGRPVAGWSSGAPHLAQVLSFSGMVPYLNSRPHA
jgi:hypothetical protein